MAVFFLPDGVGHQQFVRAAQRTGPLVPDAALVPAAAVPDAGPRGGVAGRRRRHPLQRRAALPLRAGAGRAQVAAPGDATVFHTFQVPSFVDPAIECSKKFEKKVRLDNERKSSS